MRPLLLIPFIAAAFGSFLTAAEVRKGEPVVKRAEAVNQPATSSAADSTGVPANAGIATLRVGDVFEMRLSGMPSEAAGEFQQQYTVGTEGNVNIPLVGDCRAAGYTPGQLEKSIQQRLVAEKIFTKPTVVINVQPSARFISVGGGVRSPQRMQWAPDLTLNSAINNAGGPSDFGNTKKVRLIREGKIVGVFDLRKFEKDPSLDPKLLPGDQIDVPQ